MFSTSARRDSTPFSPMQTLADFSHKIVPLKDPGKMKKPLFRLLYTVKMIFDVSTFYNRFINDFSRQRLIDVLPQPREGGLPHCEDHQPSDPQLQALHHRKRQLDDMGSGKTHCAQRYHSNRHNSYQQQEAHPLIMFHRCQLVFAPAVL